MQKCALFLAVIKSLHFQSLWVLQFPYHFPQAAQGGGHRTLLYGHAILLRHSFSGMVSCLFITSIVSVAMVAGGWRQGQSAACQVGWARRMEKQGPSFFLYSQYGISPPLDSWVRQLFGPSCSPSCYRLNISPLPHSHFIFCTEDNTTNW